MESIRAGAWNVRWTSDWPGHFTEAQNRIAKIDADILVLTETTDELVPEGGYVAKSGPDWGYERGPGQRKVFLWSRWPITDVTNDIVEPSGRHVAATVQSPLGPVRVHGVCVPWSRAHVSGGQENRKVWQDHLVYLTRLQEVLNQERNESRTAGLPVILAGDINQRDQPAPDDNRKAVRTLEGLLADFGLTTVTDETMIDLVAVGPELVASDPAIHPPDPMSDQHAVSCLLTVAAPNAG